MNAAEATESVKDFVRAYPGATRTGDLGVVEATPAGRSLRLSDSGRMFVDALVPMRISREQFRAILREVVNTEPNHAKARVKVIAMARAASKQAWIDTNLSARAVVRTQPDDDGVGATSDAVPRLAGETLLEFSRRLLTQHRDMLSNEEVARIEAFVRSRERVRPRRACADDAEDDRHDVGVENMEDR